MRPKIHISFFVFLLVLFCVSNPLKAQLGFELDIKKPEPFENRELKAEKTPDKKIKQPRRSLQNLTTHYNYFFNSKARLDAIIENAKSQQKVDYALMLPFYNYSLDETAQDSAQLDSVIYKSKTGIVLHDLRNDWIDDLYMLWGAAYYFQQQYDSAYQMFQFINYAFADKEKDGYYRYIGSRMDGNNASSIATPEDRNLLNRMLTDPPARNNAFIWQIRTLIGMEAFSEAASLIATLRNDIAFPERLKGDLDEVTSYWYYKQQLWDSSAYHLVKALDGVGNKKEKSRWEYLAAQMFERKDLNDLARDYYAKAISHTDDPVLEVYARLNMTRINKDGTDDYIDRNIAELVKMSKRDRYEEYRDVIYSMAAEMELERGNVERANEFLVLASQYKTENTLASNRAYLQLADLAFARKAYQQSASFYDSLNKADLSPEVEERIAQRKEILKRVLTQLNSVNRQDSLQKIAALPEADRTAFIKKLVRQLRRQQGLKDETVLISGSVVNNPFPNPFADKQTKGDWYFYNNNLKANGITSFKQVWGNRPNVDNWRRFSDVTAQLKNTLPNSGRDNTAVINTANLPPTYDVLLNNVPITPEQITLSNDSIRTALFALADIYVHDIEDYEGAQKVYEDIKNRFGDDAFTSEALYNLYVSYSKKGNAAQAAETKKILLNKYPADRFATLISTGTDPFSNRPAVDATKNYEAVYDLYLEGRFQEAKQAKNRADSIYKTNYWSPQLLYIESVYHIQRREDSIAKQSLATLISQNSGTPLGDKAQNMLQVLNRRAQIEDELTKLQITRPIEDSLFVEPMPIAASNTLS
jgi:outer membrane protein assembly factor BamD (BamD/ComL family)